MRVVPLPIIIALTLALIVAQSRPFLASADNPSDKKPLLRFRSMLETGSSLENTTLKQGQASIVPIVAEASSNYEVDVSLEVQDVPPHVHAWIVWNSFPVFDNNDYELDVNADSNAEPGQYVLKIVGSGIARNLSTSEDIQVVNETFGMLHLTVAPSGSSLIMDIGEPQYDYKQLCVKDITSPGGGTMCAGFVASEEFPITVFSRSNASDNQTVALSADVPEGVWAKFIPAEISLSGNSGVHSASGKLLLAGAVKPFGGFSPNTIALAIVGSASNGDSATDYLAIERTMNITVLHSPDAIDFPSEIVQNINGTNFAYAGVVFDSDDNKSSLPVKLSVAGISTAANPKIVSPLPSWIEAELPSSTFMLNSSEPYYFLAKISTHLAPVGTYHVVIDEWIGDSHFTGDVKVDITPPSYLGGPATLPSLPMLSIRRLDGGYADMPKTGQQLMLVYTIRNEDNLAKDFVGIIEVRDSDGVTVYLAWQSNKVAPNSEYDMGVSWQPGQPSTYHIRTFAVSDFAKPRVLSAVSTSEITVS